MPPPPQAPWRQAGVQCTLPNLKSELLRISVSWKGLWGGGRGWEASADPGGPGEQQPGQGGGHFPLSTAGCAFLPLTLILSAAAKLSCSYSGFSSPRVEWKFAQGDITSLVCYHNKITGEPSPSCPCPGRGGLAEHPGRGAPWGSSPMAFPPALQLTPPRSFSW